MGTLLPQSSTTDVLTPNVATVTVQVAYNPGHQNIPVNTSTCLFNTSGLPGVTVRSYSAQVGRNF